MQRALLLPEVRKLVLVVAMRGILPQLAEMVEIFRDFKAIAENDTIVPDDTHLHLKRQQLEYLEVIAAGRRPEKGRPYPSLGSRRGRAGNDGDVDVRARGEAAAKASVHDGFAALELRKFSPYLFQRGF